MLSSDKCCLDSLWLLVCQICSEQLRRIIFYAGKLALLYNIVAGDYGVKKMFSSVINPTLKNIENVIHTNFPLNNKCFL